jgi:hypothetical protein
MHSSGHKYPRLATNKSPHLAQRPLPLPTLATNKKNPFSHISPLPLSTLATNKNPILAQCPLPLPMEPLSPRGAVLKDRLGDQRRGREWEPIKNLPERLTWPTSQIHNQGFPHTSLPRSRSHSGPTNPTNKSKQVAKRKHNSRSKDLTKPGRPWADRPRLRGGRTVHEPGGRSDPVRQTVHKFEQNLESL